MKKDTYDVHAIEKKWQAAWKKANTFAAQPLSATQASPYYCLVMFPYPSGNIHMGHVRNYAIGDVLARHRRMKGANVLHPIGWDAFGLPAENAAIKNKVDPEKWTRENIATMRAQLQALGISYDWDREFATCDPDYYRWNQWFFLKFYEKGLAYRKKASVNWCPSCQTVLANEQVSAEGLCWRCDSQVTHKALEQWFLKITAYAERLLQDMEDLRGAWPDEVLTMQTHWIGRSEGAEVVFILQDTGRPITVFTTRPDTLFGATYLALAPDHPLVRELAYGTVQEAALEKLQAETAQRRLAARQGDVQEKNGVFLGRYAVNPVNNQPIPIWAADYVLLEYGTGAIMCVPAHDQRDFEFATKYGIPIVPVIQPSEGSMKRGAYEGEGTMINSGSFNGLPSVEGRRRVAAWLKQHNVGGPAISYKLRDWLISRQRYWGTPIPILYCDRCGEIPVPEKDLPVLLPKNVKFTGMGESPLAHVKDFVQAACPRCKGKARRETDTMDTFVDSSWYYARYGNPRNLQAPFDPTLVSGWLPVTQYIGGIEHACMHLIYARFWHKAMGDLGLVQSKEPFARLLTQGMVTLGGAAMSKSKGNIVDPNAIIAKYGADTARLFILFAAPPEKQLEWSDEGVEGAWRFLNRVWRLVERISRNHPEPVEVHPELVEGDKPVCTLRRAQRDDMVRQAHHDEETDKLLRKQHWAIHKVTQDIEKEFQLNTAIAAIIELVNEMYAYLGEDGPVDDISRSAARTVVQLLSPFAPHLSEELWERMGERGLCSQFPWPQADPCWQAAEKVEVVVQINGKLRSRIQLPADSSDEDLQRMALEDPKVKTHITDHKIAKVIVVPKKLVNIVTEGAKT